MTGFPDIPACLRRAKVGTAQHEAEEAARLAYWAANPPRPIQFVPTKTRDESVETQLFREQEEERRRLKALGRIDKMKAKQVDRTGMRWDDRRNRWKPILPGTGLKAPVVTETAPKPAPVKDDATRAQLEAQARAAGVWKDSYAALSNGLFAMTVNNRLKKVSK